MPPISRKRKLLVASVGVATVSYVALTGCKETPISGNLPAPPPPDAGSPRERPPPPDTPPVVGNLPAPPPIDTPGVEAATDAGADAKKLEKAGDFAEPPPDKKKKP